MAEAEETPLQTNWSDWLWIALAALGAVALRLAFANQRGFWLDEWYTHYAAGFPFDWVAKERMRRGHFPLPFYYARLFLLNFGGSEIAVRASSAVMTGFATIAAGAICLQLGLRRVLAPLLVMAIFHPYWQNIGTEFRYMMPLVAAAGFFVLFALRLVQGARWFDYPMTLLTGAVMLSIHGSAQFIFFAVMAFVCWSTWRHPPARAGRAGRVALRAGLLLLCLVPVVPQLRMISGDNPGSGGSAEFPDPIRALVNQVETFFGEDGPAEFFTGIDDDVFTLFAIAAYALGLVLTWRFLRRERVRYGGKLLAALLVGVPLGVMIFTATVDSVQGPLRYVAFTSLPLLLVFAIAWEEARRLGRFAFVTRGFLAFVIGMNFLVQAFNQGVWHRETLQWLREHRTAEQPILAIGKEMNLKAMRHHDIWGAVGLNEVHGDLNKTVRDLESIFRKADSGFVFVYHPGDVPIEKALRRLRREGYFSFSRVWHPTDPMVLIGLARTERGEQQLREMPPFPMPVIGESVPDVEDWEEFDDLR